MIWATVSSWSCFYWLYRASPSLATKNIINLILVLTIWWCPCVSLLLCCWKGVFAMTSAFSWQNSISHCPASFCIPRPNLPVIPGIYWLPTFAFQSPIKKRTTFWGVSSKRSCRSRRTIQLQLLQHYWLGHRLGLPWYWMVCLGNEQAFAKSEVSVCLRLQHSTLQSSGNSHVVQRQESSPGLGIRSCLLWPK